jgi:phosphatidylglycerol---prolipoprotein diacylglyceryl transferase
MTGLPFPNIDPIALQLGPLAIRWYGLAYLAGFLVGWRTAVMLVRRTGGRPNTQDLDDYLVWVVFGVVVGGRLGSVLFYNLPYYIAHPQDILQVWKGGMAFHGGMLGVALATILFAWRRHLPLMRLGDLVAAAVPIGLFFGRIANFINGELYGRAGDVPWAMVFPADPLGVPRHPSQLYEAALEGLLLFTILVLAARTRWVSSRHGLVVGLFLMGYGLARTVVELFREPDANLGFLIGGATMGQLLSLPMIIAGVLVAAWAVRRGPVAAQPTDDDHDAEIAARTAP